MSQERVDAHLIHDPLKAAVASQAVMWAAFKYLRTDRHGISETPPVSMEEVVRLQQRQKAWLIAQRQKSLTP